MRKPRRRTALAILAAVVLLVAVAIGVALTGSPRPSPAAQPLGAASSPDSLAPPPLSGPSPSPSSPVPPSVAGSPRSTSSPRPVPATVTGRKKGVSAWYVTGAAQALHDVRAAWFYTWAPDPGRIGRQSGIEFVPMIWGAGSADPTTLARVRAQGSALLGFNEPDLGSQANMTVGQALDLWPKLMATGLRLGSPAPATGAADPGGWLDGFMAGAAARGYRVDFIALHWYGADFGTGATEQLRSYLDATYRRYHKPIWLTEYALIRFGATTTYPSPAQQADFVRASTAMLEGLPYLERYAWFALSAGGTGLYRDDGTPTVPGVAYRDAP